MSRSRPVVLCDQCERIIDPNRGERIYTLVPHKQMGRATAGERVAWSRRLCERCYGGEQH